MNGSPVVVEANGTFVGYVPVPRGPRPVLEFVSRRGGDSIVHRVVMRRGDPTSAVTGAGAGMGAVTGPADSVTADAGVRTWGRWVVMRRLPSDTADSATQWRPIYARWRPGGAVAIPLPQGMRMYADAVYADARSGSWARLRLSPSQRVWVSLVDVDSASVLLRSAAARAPESLLRAGAPIVRAESASLALSIALPERLPTTVELAGDRLYWTVYGAAWDVLPGAGEVGGRLPVRRVVPTDSAAGRVVIEMELSEMPLGWRTEWREGALHLVIRRIPDGTDGVRGLAVVLDPGHPPDGSMGPSRLREDSVTLAVALRAAERLRALGARVSLTRSTAGPFSLEARAAIAERSDAHLFVSIHLNSPGAGRPPAAVNGSMAYWMNPNARALAGILQHDVAESMGQVRLGARDGEYAVLRPAWMTSVLVEGAGIVMPEREAYLRTDAGISAYADGIVRGIVRWSGASDSRRVRGWSTPPSAVQGR